MQEKCCGIEDTARDYFVRIGLHQSLTMNSLFNLSLALDVLSRGIQKIIPKCILFADGIVLIEESREEIKSKLALETDIGIKGLSLELE